MKAQHACVCCTGGRFRVEFRREVGQEGPNRCGRGAGGGGTVVVLQDAHTRDSRQSILLEAFDSGSRQDGRRLETRQG